MLLSLGRLPRSWKRAVSRRFHDDAARGGVRGGDVSAEVHGFLRSLDSAPNPRGRRNKKKASTLRRSIDAPGQLFRLQKLNDKKGAEELFQKLSQAGIANSHCHSIMLRFDNTSDRQRRGLARVVDMRPPSQSIQRQPSSKELAKLVTMEDFAEANVGERVPANKVFSRSYWDDISSSSLPTVHDADVVTRLSPCSWTFSMLVDQLVLEGDRAAAERVIRDEMALHGIKPVPRTFRELELPEEAMTLRRQNRLDDLIARILGQEQITGGPNKGPSTLVNLEGEAPARDDDNVPTRAVSDDYDFMDYSFDDYDVQAQGKVSGRDHPPEHLRQIADEFFDALRGNGVANATMYTSMMKLSRTTSDALLLLNNMEAEGLSPLPHTYHEIVSKALLEGDRAMAIRLIKKDMMDRGLVPKSETLGLVKHFGKYTYSGKRLDTLNALLREGESEGELEAGRSSAALAWFTRLQRNRVADVRAYNLMLAHTQRREDWLKLLGEMKGAGIKPNENTMAVLAKLMAESHVAIVRKPGGYKKKPVGR